VRGALRGTAIPAARAESAALVRAARAYAHLSRDELSARVGLNRSALLRIESGNAPLDSDLAGRLASVTHVPTWFLLDGFERRS
jgi:transcriptional regulator with XRE-family HTH domain